VDSPWISKTNLPEKSKIKNQKSKQNTKTVVKKNFYHTKAIFVMVFLIFFKV